MLDHIVFLRADDHLRFLARPISSRYWRPGEDWIKEIINRTKMTLRPGDFIVISEKAISIAKGNIVDENLIMPSFLAKLLVIGFMRVIWGRIFGWICHLSRENILRLRNYPLLKGAAHKQLALNRVGFFQAMRHGSEGGIDTSNLPFSLVALPLPHPDRESKRIQKKILEITGILSTVLIVDSDKTYSFNNFHMSVRSTKIRGIICLGLFAYFFGRLLKLRPRSTPLGMAGKNLKKPVTSL